ncbi:IncF plasmid conjugative transfer pilusassembly protein TraH [Salmonella enterica subsp. arizonae]|uniref:IncF plasmid conjugative transfer pilusassembly protein TraH n=1 Tax=Salmonella enterica subsp. arizonae TaxID=59203 RepID=A0A379T3R4_SALER|nr:IncF plasmid conjugative transfer pilusassembly protein TraH [Salmonella enterica subsp. arizonae]
MLKAFSQKTGFDVFPISLDGKGDAEFPDVLPATPDVMVEYFQSGLPVATPTTFLTNVNTMENLAAAAGLPQRQVSSAVGSMRCCVWHWIGSQGKACHSTLRDNNNATETALLGFWRWACTVQERAHAGLQDDMNSFFNDMSYASNTTSAKAWQGQAARYVSGGSFYARTGNKNIQLVSISLPSIKRRVLAVLMCIWGRSLFINSDQIMAFVKQTMANAAGYFFDLALETTVPELKAAERLPTEDGR